MSVWWENLSAYQQVMFVIAITATIILFIFLILMIIGFEGGESFNDVSDISVEGIDSINDEPIISFSGLKVFTLRGILAFLSIGAWVGYIIDDSLNLIITSLISAFCGLVAAFLMAFALKASMKLESEGNLDYKNAIGKSGIVYIRIPNKRSGTGKVTLIIQERYIEVEAMTDDEEDLKTGSNVEVVGLDNESTLIVKRK